MFKRKFAVLALIAALITTSFAVAGCSSQGGENGETVITMSVQAGGGCGF